LRENVYRILDEVLETGVPVDIQRKGQTLKIVRVEEAQSSWLDRLPERPEVIEGDPEDLVHIDWSKGWRPGPI
jgi:hypothetical protein